tara:strand:- start:511 stop:1494 length:984 start_codon:yes stop_codon:yes gene_type:complete
MNETNNCVYQTIDVKNNDYLTIAQIKHLPQDTFHHISLHNAMSMGYITIKETSESGSVNNILVINESEDSVFMMDGDLLKGAKQNRVLNSSILLPPNSKSIIPVSCVEQGRWSDRTPHFSPSDEIAAKNIRMGKHDNIFSKSNIMPSHTKHFVDQGEVWDNVSMCASISGTTSSAPTGSHSDMFAAKRQDFQRYVRGFVLNPDANGLAYFIDGELMGCEIFNRRSIYCDYFDKILISIAFEVDSLFLRSRQSSRWDSLFSNRKTLSNSDVSDVLYSSFFDIDNGVAAVDSCKGVALGNEFRLRDNKSMFYSLMFDDHTIHKSLLVAN